MDIIGQRTNLPYDGISADRVEILAGDRRVDQQACSLPRVGRCLDDENREGRFDYTELTLSLEGKARRKALAKARRLQKEDPPA